jgi:hypothetical protein
MDAIILILLASVSTLIFTLALVTASYPGIMDAIIRAGARNPDPAGLIEHSNHYPHRGFKAEIYTLQPYHVMFSYICGLAEVSNTDLDPDTE